MLSIRKRVSPKAHLNSLAHGHFQIELSIPQLRQVSCHFLKGLSEVEQVRPVEGLLVEGINGHQIRPFDVFPQGPLPAALI